MKIQISRREVMNNVMRFRDRVCTLEDDERKDQNRRLYHAFLNRKTGDIHFLNNPESGLSLEEWEEIQIAVNTEAHQRAHFEARDNANHPLESRGLEPLAWRVIHETLETLNHIASQSTAGTEEFLPEKSALQDLSNVHLSAFHALIEDMKGWKGSIDRINAEKLLKGAPIGTYLLREGDPHVQITALHLANANKTAVKPYLCTFVEGQQRISEVLILCTSRGWVLYRDNPDLLDSEYQYESSPQAVFKNLHGKAKRPL